MRAAVYAAVDGRSYSSALGDRVLRDGLVPRMAYCAARDLPLGHDWSARRRPGTHLYLTRKHV